jgi:hypothetical protein
MKLKDVLKKKKFVWDVDGVLLDFSTDFERFVSNELGIDVNHEDYDLGIDRKTIEPIINKFWNSENFSRLKQYPSAKEVFNYIAKRTESVIATAISGEYARAREKNLSGFAYKKIHYLPVDKKKFVVNTLKPDVCIEDKPSNIEFYTNAGILTFFPSNLPYTKGLSIKYAIPYNSLEELKDKLIRII